MKTYLHRPIKTLQFLTPSEIKEKLTLFQSALVLLTIRVMYIARDFLSCYSCLYQISIMSQDVKYSKIVCYRTEPSAIWQIFYESHILQLISWSLSHSFPMLSFPTHWKHWKTVRFSDVFRGPRKGALGTNGLKGERTVKFEKRVKCLSIMHEATMW